MDPPFRAYEGSDSFLFACYSHADADTVYPSLAAMHRGGLHVWYDEGIEAGLRRFLLVDPSAS